MPVQSLWGSEATLQDYHSRTASKAPRKAWCLERLDAGNGLGFRV